MRRFILAAALGVAIAPLSAYAAGDGAGEIPCEQQVQRLTQDYNANASAMTAAQQDYFQSQLAVAKDQCGQGLDAASPTIAQIQEEMQATIQTAQTPAGADREPSPSR